MVSAGVRTTPLTLLLLAGGVLLVGCGGTGEDSATPGAEPVRAMELSQACPGVHVAYDALVAADPASARAFRESLRRLWEVGVDEMRTAVEPVIEAADVLATSDRAGYPDARDGVYRAIVTLSATCATLGAPILH